MWTDDMGVNIQYDGEVSRTDPWAVIVVSGLRGSRPVYVWEECSFLVEVNSLVFFFFSLLFSDN